MSDFYKTRMGMTFFEGTLPRLVAELARLNDNLEASRELQERMLASAEAQDKYQRARDAKFDAECNPPPGYSDGGTRG